MTAIKSNKPQVGSRNLGELVTKTERFLRLLELRECAIALRARNRRAILLACLRPSRQYQAERLG